MSSTDNTPPEGETTDSHRPLQSLITRIARLLQGSTRVPTAYLAAGSAIGLLVIIASTPAAAQEFCDDPAGQLLISIETMLINYGTMLLFLAFLIGVAMWALTPIFAGQSAIGLGMILLSFGAAIAFVVGTQFFGMTFEIAGAGGQSCSTVLN
ncbi:hypothetical protein [Halalkalicoccus subterraneus]|uniref:hypothetical protein n=1 Tax=Halalkalicoccus subterraneus TaxID=2675002 RepID=UPI001FE4A0CC|nr:hypothetical protein [Halalkalicoccus subterraneus]